MMALHVWQATASNTETITLIFSLWRFISSNVSHLQGVSVMIIFSIVIVQYPRLRRIPPARRGAVRHY